MTELDSANFRRPGGADPRIVRQELPAGALDQSIDAPPERYSPGELQWNHRSTKVADVVVRSRPEQLGRLEFSTASPFWQGMVNRTDVGRLTIIADHFVVRGRLHVPQANIRIVARVLEFVDTDIENPSSICTTPVPAPKPHEESPSAPTTHLDGSSGRQAWPLSWGIRRI